MVPVITRTKNGIEIHAPDLPGGTWYFDPRGPTPTDGHSFITHGHTDHLPSKIKGQSIYSSEITREIMRIRKDLFFEPSLPFDKNTPNSSLEFATIHSGHCHGGLMFRFKIPSGESILYTGDFNPRTRKFLGESWVPLPVPTKTDILIIESTYGVENFRFPDPVEIIKEISEFIDENINIGRNLALLGYSFGKAQILSHLCEELEIPYLVTPEIYRINLSLERFIPQKFKRGTLINPNNISPPVKETLKRGGAVIIAAPHEKRYLPRVDLTTQFSGQIMRKKSWIKADKVFPLSDHADFNDLCLFIKKCSPKMIFTFDGEADSFAKRLRKEGFIAKSLDEKPSNVLMYL